jgi:amino acid permease|tara:strand:+ start:300 stop:800 length:501 start_codon:yes stop_codon:yes gene_type:complete
MKKLNKINGLIILILFFLCTVVGSFVFPPNGEIVKSNKVYSDYSELRWWEGSSPYLDVIGVNFNNIAIFSAVYRNQILSWVGKKRYLTDKYNIYDTKRFNEEINNIFSTADEDKTYLYTKYYLYYLLPLFLPYLFILAIIIVWRKKKNERIRMEEAELWKKNKTRL